MIDAQYALAMARYNQWVNEKVYAACERMDDVQRRQDRGAFFKSIHSTLNHVLWGDYIWMGRFVAGTPLAKTYPRGAIGVDLFDQWDELRTARREMDADILDWAGKLDAQWLARDFTWMSALTRTERTKPAWLLVAHLFNHQTHHRGQVTALLMQAGIDPGDIDLPLM